MFDEEDHMRLPVHLWIDAQLRPLSGNGIFYYILQRGEQNSGVILLKINNLQGQCRLVIQQRGFDGALGWMNAINKDLVDESQADDYIQRSILHDPDLWVIEIEDREMSNPFEGKMI